MKSIRVYEMPPCKMVSSGKGMLGKEKFDKFESWFSSQKRGMFPKVFLCWEDGGFVWLYMYEDGMEVPDEFEIIDFNGGLYAVATDIDRKTDMENMRSEVCRFLNEHGFERDTSRTDLANVITPAVAHDIMEYDQMDYYTPIKEKG